MYAFSNENYSVHTMNFPVFLYVAGLFSGLLHPKRPSFMPIKIAGILLELHSGNLLRNSQASNKKRSH